MKKQIKKGMSREDATSLYKQLQGQINKDPSLRERIKGAVGGQVRGSTRAASNTDSSWLERTLKQSAGQLNGNSAAVALVVIFACAKIGISVLEASGIANLENAQASMVSSSIQPAAMMAPRGTPGDFTKEEVKVLTMLDARRTELESKSTEIARRDGELRRKEQELAIHMNELKSLTDKLKVNREQDDRKRTAQIDQLSKVYSSMAPEEAAKLIDQLDISIALAMLQRMPEKRIGQILAIMSPERALQITRMLTGN